MMPKLFYFNYCDEFEAQAFFNENGEIIHAIDNSDATWEPEYMNPLLEKLGYTIEVVEDNPEYVEKLLRWFNY